MGRLARKWGIAMVLVTGAVVIGGIAGSWWGSGAEVSAKLDDPGAVGWEVRPVQSEDTESVPYEKMCRACWLPNGSIFCGRSCDATGRTLYTPPGESLEKCGVCGDNRKWKK